MRLAPKGNDAVGAQMEYDIYPSKTYGLDTEHGRISGYVDALEAVRQAVEKALMTERYAYAAYTGNYGAELCAKLGMPASYVMPEIKRAICEALEWDSRIDSVDGFTFSREGRTLRAAFTVHSIYGDFDSETEVDG